MMPGDFADGAGKSGLLNMQETNDLFFYITAKEKTNVPFPTTCRKGRMLDIRCCGRFRSKKMV